MCVCVCVSWDPIHISVSAARQLNYDERRKRTAVFGALEKVTVERYRAGWRAGRPAGRPVVHTLCIVRTGARTRGVECACASGNCQACTHARCVVRARARARASFVGSFVF